MSQNSHFSDQDLDTLFQEAAAQGSVPAFDDAYWAEMEAMLPAKKRKGLVFWFTVSGIPLILGIVGLSLFNWNRSDISTATELKNIQTANTTLAENKSTEKQTNNYSELGNKEVEVLPNTAESNNKLGTPTEQLAKPTKAEKNGPVAPSVIENNPAKEQKQDLAIRSNSEENSTDFESVLGRKGTVFTMPATLNDVSINNKSNRFAPFYVDFGLGYGQSYRKVVLANNWMSQFKVGAGVYTEIGNMKLSAGLDFRGEVPNNLSRVTYDVYSNQSGSVNSSNVTNMRGIYNLEFPLYIGGSWGRSSLGGMMSPGIQLGFSGTKTHFENETLISRTKTAGSIPDSKSLTMEFGARYGYALTEHVEFAASLNFDILRPFQSDTYTGNTQNFPMNFFLGLRRNF